MSVWCFCYLLEANKFNKNGQKYYKKIKNYMQNFLQQQSYNYIKNHNHHNPTCSSCLLLFLHNRKLWLQKKSKYKWLKNIQHSHIHCASRKTREMRNNEQGISYVAMRDPSIPTASSSRIVAASPLACHRFRAFCHPLASRAGKGDPGELPHSNNHHQTKSILFQI